MHTPQSARPNWKLVGGLALAVVGIGAILATQRSGISMLAYLPYLLILACPVMMLFMMGSMGHNHMAGPNTPQGDASDDSPHLAGLSHDEQVRALRGQLTRMAWRQEALRHGLDLLEAERVADAEKTVSTR